jgi:hypothetical protein
MSSWRGMGLICDLKEAEELRRPQKVRERLGEVRGVQFGEVGLVSRQLV